MSFLTSLISGIIALKEVLALIAQLYSSVKEIRQKQNESDALKAIDAGDTIGLEKAIGNPDAGKPSGIGQVRPK